MLSLPFRIRVRNLGRGWEFRSRGSLRHIERGGADFRTAQEWRNRIHEVSLVRDGRREAWHVAVGRIAVRALIALAELPEGEFEGSSAVAKKVGAPPNYLGKLLQTLARTGVVSSRKGLGGGWALGREPQQIRLLDIVEPVEDIARWRGCFLGRAECSDEDPCHVHTTWAPVRDAFFAFVEGTTLARLIEDGGMDRLKSMI